MARWVRLRTVPTEHPNAAAICADGLGERRLRQILGGVPVPGEQVRDPHQRRRPRGHELPEPHPSVLIHADPS